MSLGESAPAYCPKCDSPVRGQWVDELHVIDVAHGGENVYAAEQKILEGLDYVLCHSLKGLKVIHGYGSGKGHSHVIHDEALSLLRRLARKHRGRVVRDHHTSGAHILYLNESLM